MRAPDPGSGAPSLLAEIGRARFRKHMVGIQTRQAANLVMLIQPGPSSMSKDCGADVQHEFYLGCGQPGGEPHEPSHGLVLWTVGEL